MVVPTAPERSENDQREEIARHTQMRQQISGNANPELSETQFAFAPVVGLRASFGLRWPFIILTALSNICVTNIRRCSIVHTPHPESPESQSAREPES